MMGRPPAALLAERAPLARAQKKFRAASRGQLAFCLPRSVWLDHGFSVLPGGKPVAVRGGEARFSWLDVVSRAVNPRARRRVVVLNGGSMSNAGLRRR